MNGADVKVMELPLRTWRSSYIKLLLTKIVRGVPLVVKHNLSVERCDTKKARRYKVTAERCAWKLFDDSTFMTVTMKTKKERFIDWH